MLRVPRLIDDETWSIVFPKAMNLFSQRLHRNVAIALLGAIAALVASAQVAVNNAVYAYDQAMRNYGLITFGNTTLSNYGDTWGPLAVGGNLTLNGSGSIAQKPRWC